MNTLGVFVSVVTNLWHKWLTSMFFTLLKDYIHKGSVMHLPNSDIRGAISKLIAAFNKK